MGKVMKKEDLKRFLMKLNSSYEEVYIPVKEEADILRFKKFNGDNFSKIDFTKNTRFPPLKKHLMPQKEKLFDIKNNELSKKEKIPEVAIFGVKRCDLTSLSIIDKFLEEDSDYKERRNKLLVIGFECSEPEESCFCQSMELTPVFDLFFHTISNGPYKENYFIEVGSEKGRKLVSNLKESKEDMEEDITKQAECSKQLQKKDFAKIFDNEAWKEGSERCLSCGMCNNLCPTCLCFDIKDEMELNLKDGKRVKVWDYCHSKDFTKVAGNHIFRADRNSRFKHRIFHKLQYFPDKYKMFMCTGCGRCIKYCPTKIDFVELTNKIN